MHLEEEPIASAPVTLAALALFLAAIWVAFAIVGGA